MRGFLMHGVVYVAVNSLLVASWILFGSGTADQAAQSLTSLDTARQLDFWPLYVMIFWGAALLIHGGAALIFALPTRKRRRAKRRQRAALQAQLVGALGDTAVSYTHLTLPTILRV